MKHVVCYSGGHSSALVAIKVVRKYGAANVILLNHDIAASVEPADVKRFKAQISNYLACPITFANYKGLSADKLPDQFDVVVDSSAFKVGSGSELCTARLKTEPFLEWLNSNFPTKDCVIYYGFDANEKARIQRRSQILGALGYKSDYPLAFWPSDVSSTKELGIEPPLSYEQFKHANCVGCLKARKQHWYVVYCTRPDIWEKAIWAEEEIGYSIIPDAPLLSLVRVFSEMWVADIPATEHIAQQTFWALVRKAGIDTTPDTDTKPCECVV